MRNRSFRSAIILECQRGHAHPCMFSNPFPLALFATALIFGRVSTIIRFLSDGFASQIASSSASSAMFRLACTWCRVFVSTTNKCDCKRRARPQSSVNKRGAHRCIHTARTSGADKSHSIGIEEVCRCAGVRCSHTLRCLQRGEGPPSCSRVFGYGKHGWALLPQSTAASTCRSQPRSCRGTRGRGDALSIGTLPNRQWLRA